MMKIEHYSEGQTGSFKAVLDEQVEAGILTYVWAGDSKIIIEHTIVPSAFSGQGIGKKLVLEAVSYARENTLKIVPVCSYAAALFEKTKEIQDVLF
jgi:uncharacterized protein